MRTEEVNILVIAAERLRIARMGVERAAAMPSSSPHAEFANQQTRALFGMAQRDMDRVQQLIADMEGAS